jgi:hypothetical protein
VRRVHDIPPTRDVPDLSTRFATPVAGCAHDFARRPHISRSARRTTRRCGGVGLGCGGFARLDFSHSLTPVPACCSRAHAGGGFIVRVGAGEGLYLRDRLVSFTACLSHPSGGPQHTRCSWSCAEPRAGLNWEKKCGHRFTSVGVIQRSTRVKRLARDGLRHQVATAQGVGPQIHGTLFFSPAQCSRAKTRRNLRNLAISARLGQLS